jgi:hypothetical protein
MFSFVSYIKVKQDPAYAHKIKYKKTSRTDRNRCNQQQFGCVSHYFQNKYLPTRKTPDSLLSFTYSSLMQLQAEI